MITKEQIKEIIEEAVHAPSGDNSQPWKFRVDGNKIDILGIPGRDATLYNFEHRGDLIAHGAIIENICIIAKDRGYETIISLFPDEFDATHTAMIEITGEGAEKENGDPLRKKIAERSTNRKPYQKEALTEQQKEIIRNVAKEVGMGEIHLADTRDAIDAIAKIASVNERLLLENKHIHDFLFSIIRWNDKEEQEHPGMHIKTLELAPPQQAVFRLLKSWNVVSVLSRLGIASFIAKENAKVYASSGAMVAIVMDDERPESFVTAGRIFERTWLTITEMGLSLQPLAAVPYLAQRVEAGATDELSADQIEMVKKADKELRKNIGVTGQPIMMLARIGRGEAPSAHAIKRSPVIEWKK